MLTATSIAVCTGLLATVSTDLYEHTSTHVEACTHDLSGMMLLTYLEDREEATGPIWYRTFPGDGEFCEMLRQYFYGVTYTGGRSYISPLKS